MFPASALGELGRYKEEIMCYDHALELNSQLEQAWSDKSVALVAIGQYGEALACLERALELDPQDAFAWCNKGIVLANHLQRYREALKCFEEAHRLGHPQASQAITRIRKML